MNNKEPFDVDWLAERFVLDELDDRQIQECEHRLESDQSFREAVARAMELLSATSHALREPAVLRASSRSWTSLLLGISVGVAASLLLAVAVTLFGFIQVGPRLAHPLAIDDATEDAEDPTIAAHWKDRVRFDDPDNDAIDAVPQVFQDEIRASEAANPPSPWLFAIAKLPEESDEQAPMDGSDG